MASWFEQLLERGEYGFPRAFTDACPASSTTNAMKAKAEELEQTWHPTGYYTWQEMADLVAAAVEMSSKASTMAYTAFEQNPNDILRKAVDEYMEVARQASENYVPAWRAAKEVNAPVNAPGLKRWVIELLNRAHKLARVSEISVCTAPWWYGALSTFMYYFNKVVDIAKKTVGVVVKAGQAIVDAVEDVFDLWPFVKWGSLALGAVFAGVFLWNKLQFVADEARKPINWDRVRERWIQRARRAAERARGGVRRLFPARRALPAGSSSSSRSSGGGGGGGAVSGRRWR